MRDEGTVRERRKYVPLAAVLRDKRTKGPRPSSRSCLWASYSAIGTLRRAGSGPRVVHALFDAIALLSLH